jgi:hypothetical protein
VPGGVAPGPEPPLGTVTILLQPRTTDRSTGSIRQLFLPAPPETRASLRLSTELSVSLPPPPDRRSRPLPPCSLSAPAPLSSLSAPAPPSSLSRPAPAKMRSPPPRPFALSFPERRRIVSAFLVPLTRLALLEPVKTLASAIMLVASPAIIAAVAIKPIRDTPACISCPLSGICSGRFFLLGRMRNENVAICTGSGTELGPADGNSRTPASFSQGTWWRLPL